MALHNAAAAAPEPNRSPEPEFRTRRQRRRAAAELVELVGGRSAKARQRQADEIRRVSRGAVSYSQLELHPPLPVQDVAGQLLKYTDPRTGDCRYCGRKGGHDRPWPPNYILIHGVVRRAHQLGFTGTKLSMEEIGIKVGCSRRTVLRAIDWLEEHGELHVVTRKLDAAPPGGGWTRRKIPHVLMLGPVADKPRKVKEGAQKRVRRKGYRDIPSAEGARNRLVVVPAPPPPADPDPEIQAAAAAAMLSLEAAQRAAEKARVSHPYSVTRKPRNQRPGGPGTVSAAPTNPPGRGPGSVAQTPNPRPGSLAAAVVAASAALAVAKSAAPRAGASPAGLTDEDVARARARARARGAPPGAAERPEPTPDEISEATGMSPEELAALELALETHYRNERTDDDEQPG